MRNSIVSILICASFIVCSYLTYEKTKSREPQATVSSSEIIEIVGICTKYVDHFQQGKVNSKTYCDCMDSKISAIQEVHEQENFRKFLLDYWQKLMDSKNQEDAQRITGATSEADPASVELEQQLAEQCFESNK